MTIYEGMLANDMLNADGDAIDAADVAKAVDAADAADDGAGYGGGGGDDDDDDDDGDDGGGGGGGDAYDDLDEAARGGRPPEPARRRSWSCAIQGLSCRLRTSSSPRRDRDKRGFLVSGNVRRPSRLPRPER